MHKRTQRIGFVGLGLMGLPMAQKLLSAGADLTVFNRTASKANPLISDGAKRADTISELAHEVRGGTVVICVSDTPAVEQTIRQVAYGDLSATLVIDMSTTTVEATRRMACLVTAEGGAFVDASCVRWYNRRSAWHFGNHGRRF